MSIRPLVAADVPTLARELGRLSLLIRYGRDPAKLEGDLHAALDRGDGLIVEEAPGRLRGLAWFHSTGTFALGGYLRLIAVAPDVTGSGIGSSLLAAFEVEVAKDSRHAFLLVSDFNSSAQRFYERHGYQRIGAIPGLVLPDVAEWVYWKRLR